MTRPGPTAQFSVAGPGLVGVRARPLALYAASHFACNFHEVCFLVSRKRWNINDVVSKLERVIGELHATLVGKRDAMLWGALMLVGCSSPTRNCAGRVASSGVIIYDWRRLFWPSPRYWERAACGIGVIAGLCILSAQLVAWGLRAVGLKGCGGIAPVK